MDKELRIDGLTRQQVAMLDIMWALDSPRDYEHWKNALSESDMNLADTLEILLIMEAREDDLSQTLTQAQDVIAKIMRKTQ